MLYLTATTCTGQARVDARPAQFRFEHVRQLGGSPAEVVLQFWNPVINKASEVEDS